MEEGEQSGRWFEHRKLWIVALLVVAVLAVVFFPDGSAPDRSTTVYEQMLSAPPTTVEECRQLTTQLDGANATTAQRRCVLLLAQQTMDASVCDSLSDPRRSACRAEVAAMTGDPDVCRDETGECQEIASSLAALDVGEVEQCPTSTCRQTYAVLEEDAQHCGNSLLCEALAKREARLCESLSASAKSSCQYLFAILTKNASACEDMWLDRSREQCVFAVAQTSQNPVVCEFFSGENEKECKGYAEPRTSEERVLSQVYDRSVRRDVYVLLSRN